MALLKIKCPECNAGLKSATGFTPGQTVCCPKCETYFAVEEPADEEEDEEKPKEKAKPSKEKDAPTGKKPVKAAVADEEEEDEDEEKPKKKKKKKRSAEEDEEGGSYKKSPLRFVILGILIIVMLVLGYLFYEKKKKEKESAAITPPAATVPDPQGTPIRLGPGPKDKLPKENLPKENLPKENLPKENLPKKGKGSDLGVIAGNAVGGWLGGGPASPEKVVELTQKYTTALVGVWTADLGNGVMEELTYKADGTFTANRTGEAPTTANGKYTVKTLAGTKGLKIQLDTAAGARTITAIFEDNELQHPSLQQGVTATFRKK